MEYSMNLFVWSSLFLSVALVLVLSRNGKHEQRLPGPTGWPIIGNIFDLGTIPHQTLYNLRPKYGHVLGLKLGSVNTLVIQSANAATDFFKNHDHVFCDRKHLQVLTAHNYYQGSLALGRYGAYWRILRRVCTMELLVSRRITQTAHLRRKCIDNMIKSIEEEESREVNLAHLLFVMAFNLIGNLTMSRDLLDSRSEQGEEFFAAMNKVMEWAGKPNLADLLPFLTRFDPQGLKRNMDRDMGRAIKIVAGFVKRRVEEDKSITKEKTKDFLDGLLEYEGDGKEGPDNISFQNTNIIVLKLQVAPSNGLWRSYFATLSA